MTKKVDPDVVAAWDEYRDATSGKDGQRYREIESWAWMRLTRRLRRISARRKEERVGA